MVDVYVESAIFYNCMREAIVLAGNSLSKKHEVAVKAFAENASDFQILYTAMTNELTNHHATLEEEQALVSIFKESLDLNTIALTEGVDFSIMEELHQTIRPLAEIGLSSKEVMADGFGLIAEALTIQQLNEDGKAVAAGYMKQADAAQQAAKNFIASAQNAQKAGNQKLQMQQTEKARQANVKARQFRDKAKEIMVQVSKDETPVGAAKKFGREAARSTKVAANKAGQAVVAAGNTAVAKGKEVKDATVNKAKEIHGNDNVQKAVLNTDKAVRDTAKKVKDTAVAKGTNLKNIVTKDADKIADAYKQGSASQGDGHPSDGAVSNLSKIQQVANGALAAGKAMMGTATGQGLAAGAVAGVLAYAGYKTYKRFFSKAAKACAGKSGAEKTACMAQYKNQAVQAQIKDLQAGSKACAKSKDPAKCKAAVQGKIAKLQASIK